MVRRVRRVKTASEGTTPATGRAGNRRISGQSLVEFALVGIFLFFLLLGIMELGRFLFVYSVISNAAQEGTRFGIVRPRSVISASGVQTQIARGTPTYIPEITVSGNCNIVDKAKDKVWGIPRNEVNVAVWFDRGDGTPIVVNKTPPASSSSAATTSYYENVIDRGNRIIVETSYRFYFIVPFISKFAPNGIDVKMRSARTLTNSGAGAQPPCDLQNVVAPTPNTTATAAAAAATSTAQASATSAAATQTATAMPAGCPFNIVVEAYKASGYNRPYVRISVRDSSNVLISGASVTARVGAEQLTATTNASGIACIAFNDSYDGASVSGDLTVTHPSNPSCPAQDRTFTTLTTGMFSCP